MTACKSFYLSPVNHRIYEEAEKRTQPSYENFITSYVINVNVKYSNFMFLFYDDVFFFRLFSHYQTYSNPLFSIIILLCLTEFFPGYQSPLLPAEPAYPQAWRPGPNIVNYQRHEQCTMTHLSNIGNVKTFITALIAGRNRVPLTFFSKNYGHSSIHMVSLTGLPLRWMVAISCGLLQVDQSEQKS